MQTNAKVAVHYVINRNNVGGIEELLEEWYYYTKLIGITFSFYTPDWGVEDKLWLSLEERDEIVQKLVKLKKKYMDFLLLTNYQLDALKSKNSSKVFGNRCLLKKKVSIALDDKGVEKSPCVMGPKADCIRCGCNVPTMLHAIMERKNFTMLYGFSKH